MMLLCIAVVWCKVIAPVRVIDAFVVVAFEMLSSSFIDDFSSVLRLAMPT